MIAITGASGHLGKTTLDYLLTKTSPGSLIAIVRDPAKVADLTAKGVQVRTGDYNNPASLAASLAGVDQLLLISSSAVGEERVRQHTAAVQAAKEAGVKHIFYTSATNPSPDARFTPGIDHYLTEKALKESGLTYTIFRNNIYLDVLPMVIGNAAQSGKLYFPAGDGKVSFALRADMAEALANALTTEGHANKIYDIGSPVAWSFSDIADALTQNGTPVEYVDIPTSAYEAELMKHLPAPVVKVYSGMAEAMKHNDFNQPDTALQTLLGRPPVSLTAFLKNRD
ncbi:SDR family oxidoreductase [Larkinella knui]|uniref:SDR family oxidoreductase n=1 Tax=Larkinella knui TaxID=2025310 RepID=A0A3P1CC33_9BACT|nr:SDR family oxidoreductase [Larkinella knui]RRB10893.1 SDR family oxidoreductase [Larkinella knui]